MTLVTKNLGLVRAIEIGTTQPSNTKLIWFDSNAGQNIHKVYNFTSGLWESLSKESSYTRISPDGHTWELGVDDTGNSIWTDLGIL